MAKPIKITEKGPVKKFPITLPPSVEMSGRCAVVLTADGGYQYGTQDLILPLQPGQYFHIQIPLPTLFSIKTSDGNPRKVVSILAQLQIQRVKPALIGHIDCALLGANLPIGTIDTDWIGGENGPKDAKFAGFTWSPAVPYSGGGELDIGFTQAALGDELSINTDEFQPATIHLLRTVVTFAN